MREAQGDRAGAIAAYQSAILAAPDTPDGYVHLANLLYAGGFTPETLSILTIAIDRLPASPVLRWAHCMALLPMAYKDQEAMHAARIAFSEALTGLRRHCFASKDATREALRAVGLMSPFFLPYQGRNDSGLLAEYGAWACDVMAEAYPQHVAVTCPWQVGDKIRVGVVSGMFWRHSVWRLPTRGWVEALDRSRFKLFGYHTRNEHDDQTTYAASCFDSFIAGLRPLPQWVETIAADRLHVLIFPELAADQPSIQLASLRLAPVQCASWGQPVTTGMPTIDYYLSSAAMEPVDGDGHYTERLVRLPGLGTVYQPAFAAWGDALPTGDAWAGYGIEPGTIRFVCCQAIQKYLPAHDRLYPLIAQALPTARFVFIAVQARPAEILAARLKTVFAAAGLDAAHYCRFVPALSQAGFSALIRDAHVFLDTPDWSGCNTTLDAAMHGVPVVTLPGGSMRSRHGLAILTIAGVTETIAASLDDYLAIAIRLGRDFAWRAAISARMLANRHRLTGDTTPVRALEAFLTEAVTIRAGRT